MAYRSIQVHRLVCLGLLLILGGCAREKVFSIKPFAPASTRATQPLEHKEWRDRHQEVIKQEKQGPVDLLLIGDSITHMWDYPVQKELWEKYFVPRHAINMGFGGDRTEHVLWRLQNGELDGIAPKAAMLLIGTNNSNNDEYTAEEIADGIIANCREIRTRLPKTKILLLAIFPRGPKPDAQREKNARASKLASSIADGKTIVYMDINEKFLEPDGTLSPSIMPDYLHPSTRGYQIWAEAVIPALDELMNR